MGSRGADQGLPLSFLDLFACVASDFPDLHEHPASCSLRGLPAPRRAPPRGILCTRVMRRSQASLEYKVDLETMMRRRESYVLDFEECDPLRVKYLTRPAMRRRPPGARRLCLGAALNFSEFKEERGESSGYSSCITPPWCQQITKVYLHMF